MATVIADAVVKVKMDKTTYDKQLATLKKEAKSLENVSRIGGRSSFGKDISAQSQLAGQAVSLGKLTAAMAAGQFSVQAIIASIPKIVKLWGAFVGNIGKQAADIAKEIPPSIPSKVGIFRGFAKRYPVGMPGKRVFPMPLKEAPGSFNVASGLDVGEEGTQRSGVRKKRRAGQQLTEAERARINAYKGALAAAGAPPDPRRGRRAASFAEETVYGSPTTRVPLSAGRRVGYYPIGGITRIPTPPPLPAGAAGAVGAAGGVAGAGAGAAGAGLGISAGVAAAAIAAIVASLAIFATMLGKGKTGIDRAKDGFKQLFDVITKGIKLLLFPLNALLAIIGQIGDAMKQNSLKPIMELGGSKFWKDQWKNYWDNSKDKYLGTTSFEGLNKLAQDMVNNKVQENNTMATIKNTEAILKWTTLIKPTGSLPVQLGFDTLKWAFGKAQSVFAQ